MTTETIPGQRIPLGWVVEPAKPLVPTPPYFTLKSEVAERRKKAGDFVTPYFTKKAPDEDI